MKMNKLIEPSPESIDIQVWSTDFWQNHQRIVISINGAEKRRYPYGQKKMNSISCHIK